MHATIMLSLELLLQSSSSTFRQHAYTHMQQFELATSKLVSVMQLVTSSQALLGDTTFMSQLQQYDKDNIPPSYIAAVRPYLERTELVPDTVKKASKAAYGLCCWVRAMEAYDRCARACTGG